MNKKHVVRAAGVYASIVAGIFLILVCFNWYMLKQDLVRQGFARPNFPYVKYNQEELNKLFPQYPLENVATTQTPEETYAKFIAALKKGDVEESLKMVAEKKVTEYRDALEKAVRENRLGQIIKTIDFDIVKKEEGGGAALYRKKDTQESVVIFRKNEKGVWLIDTL